MDKTRFSRPLDLRSVHITDSFWQREIELVRTNVIPYQWDALNDRIADAAPSWCMHNFKAAGRLQQQKKALGAAWQPKKFVDPGFEVLPRGEADPDTFYGFVFQDTDFSKWIEAVGYSLMQHPDPQLEEIADGAIDVVCQAQEENGYLDTYYILYGMDGIFTNLKNYHELYCLGHLVEGAVSYYQATGKDKLLRAACRFADYVDECFGAEEGKLKGYPGHEIAEMALLKLYELTGEDRYRRLAYFFLEERGAQPYIFDLQNSGGRFDNAYYQAHRPVREQDEAVGHAVRAMYLYSGMADAARLTQDETMLEACRKLWHSVTRDKMYITGGIGSIGMGIEAFTQPFDLPNHQAYSETCAAIGLAFFARRMLQLEPKAAYGDVMEQALYNTVLSGMALDGRSFFYVNPLSVVPEACRRDERLYHVKPVRQKWFGCACCPPNIARIVSSIGAYAWTQSDDTLYTHLYLGGEVKFRGMTLSMTTGMPWCGDGEAVIHTDAPEQATLAFRLPGWSEGAQVKCAGKESIIRDGYCYLTGLWQEGDRIELCFPMRVRMQAADSRVRADAGMVAFTRGPVTFCMEHPENGDNLHLLRVDTKAVGAKCENIRVTQSEIGGVTIRMLEVPGKRIKPVTGDSLYHDWSEPEAEPVTLRLIPYFAWANRGEGEMDVWIRI